MLRVGQLEAVTMMIFTFPPAAETFTFPPAQMGNPRNDRFTFPPNNRPTPGNDRFTFPPKLNDKFTFPPLDRPTPGNEQFTKISAPMYIPSSGNNASEEASSSDKSLPPKCHENPDDSECLKLRELKKNDSLGNGNDSEGGMIAQSGSIGSGNDDDNDGDDENINWNLAQYTPWPGFTPVTEWHIGTYLSQQPSKSPVPVLECGQILEIGKQGVTDYTKFPLEFLLLGEETVTFSVEQTWNLMDSITWIAIGWMVSEEEFICYKNENVEPGSRVEYVAPCTDYCGYAFVKVYAHDNKFSSVLDSAEVPTECDDSRNQGKTIGYAFAVPCRSECTQTFTFPLCRIVHLPAQ